MKFVLTILTSLTLTLATGQNLVPNPSFEDTLYCPYYTGVMNPIVGWTTFRNSPDCFYTCSTFMNVPNSPIGYQYARTGNGMIGMLTWLNDSNDISQANYREYVGAKLTDTLVIGQKYFLSFYINFAGYLPGWMHIAANKIGLRFSTVMYDSLSHQAPLNNIAHLFTNTIYTDTVAWLKVSGSFVADSAYQYISLGNFFDDNNTDTLSLGGAFFGSAGSYYYLDDICVSTDSLTCMQTSAINNVLAIDNSKIYPNPTSDQSILQFDNTKKEICTLTLYNHSGQIMRTINNITGDQVVIQKNDLTNGLYYFVLRTGNRVIVTGKLAVD